jgi:hypothetical protein
MVSMAAVGVIASAAYLATTAGVVERFRAAAERSSAVERSEIDVAASDLWWSTGITAGCLTLFAVVLVGLAAGNLRGRQGTRIATWVVSGLGLVYASCAGIDAFSAAAVDASGGSGVENVGNFQVAAYPEWWVPLYTLLTATMLLGQVTVVVLLALSGSHPYFRGVPPRDSLPYPDLKGADWSHQQRS